MINVDTLHEYIEVHGTCWHWTKHIDYHGYGKVWFNGKPGRLAHRIVYQLLIGPIPDELPLDHLCRATHCVNPDHLEPVTYRENIRRSPLKMPGFCCNGHRLSGPNVYEPAGRPGRRQCRECHRAAALRYSRRVRRAA